MKKSIFESKLFKKIIVIIISISIPLILIVPIMLIELFTKMLSK
ncbi:hypothetical protein [Clostridium swellfunianum]|nr:hypothetical protein [Clostridium swellfunianum]